MKKDFTNIRRDYGNLSFTLQEAQSNPLEQFQLWFLEHLKDSEHEGDPTYMVLSTIDEHGFPDSRVVLLKEIYKNNFVFFTNYNSEKAKQLQYNAHAALNFYWPKFSRQVRVRGIVSKIEEKRSEDYFNSRPIKSQASAIISHQSSVIEDISKLEEELKLWLINNAKEPIVRPQYWGGYALEPIIIEFWQGRDDRLHHRVQYYIEDNIWHKRMLAP